MRKERPKLRLGKLYLRNENGEKVEVHPAETDLPDRIKLILAEALTGNKYEFVEGGAHQ